MPLFNFLFTHKKAIAICCIAIIASAVFTELVLRAVDPSQYNIFARDSSSGLITYEPNSTFNHSTVCVDNDVEINNIGFHGPDVVIPKNSNVFRIVILGNSFVEAEQVQTEDMFTTLLQEKLNEVATGEKTFEVIPIGFSGNGTYLNMLYYKLLVDRLEPDLVIELATGSEINKNEPTVKYPPRFDADGKVILELPSVSTNMTVQTLKTAARESKLVVNLAKRATLFKVFLQKQLAHPNVFLKPAGTSVVSDISTKGTSEDADKVWDIEEKLLGQFNEEVENKDSKFLLISWLPLTERGIDNLLQLSAHLNKIAQNEYFPYYDMTPEIDRLDTASGLPSMWSCDAHWTVYGHKHAAEALFTYLHEINPELLSKSK